MATLATITNRFLDAAGRAEAAPRVEHTVRALPNEDVYLFVKRIDNSRVVREADPRSAGTCWRAVLLSYSAVIALTGVLLPHAYGLLAGYQVHSLRQEQQQLQATQSALDLEIARLLSPDRLERLAAMQAFTDPAPNQVVHLNPKADQAVARVSPR